MLPFLVCFSVHRMRFCQTQQVHLVVSASTTTFTLLEQIGARTRRVYDERRPQAEQIYPGYYLLEVLHDPEVPTGESNYPQRGNCIVHTHCEELQQQGRPQWLGKDRG
eukprot:scpid60687/ scgid30525/ 